ncbi:TspO/MBR family protein [Streptomyces sp. NPDC002580]|uniref:TspO/MBR family protein n=1 Tax=Streptomyces sp. NPDC002580 TaxID=3364653 RepID=UPI003686D403
MEEVGVPVSPEDRGRRALRTYTLTAVAVVASAVAGARAVDADSAWYQILDKPPWQPPPWVFGAVWTPLYASIAWAGGRALNRTSGRSKLLLASSLGVNLALNTTWNWLFFARRSPKAGVVGTALLDAGNIDLIRRTARADSTAARALLPYGAWCAFATALNSSIAWRNRSDPR